MPDGVTTIQICILETLAAVARQYAKKGCIVSRETIAALLAKHQDLTRGVQTISRATGCLASAGYIETYRRKKYVPGVGRTWSANYYKLTGKAFKLLKRLCYQLLWIVGGPRETFSHHNPSFHSMKDTRRPTAFPGRSPPDKKKTSSEPDTLTQWRSEYEKAYAKGEFNRLKPI